MPNNLPTYDFDPGGVNPSNLIQDENHSVSPAAGNNLSYIIPRATPFFRSSVTLVRVNGAVETPLVEGVDFVFVFRFNEASIQTSRTIYGGIAFLNRNFTGTVRIKTYRTLGGQWTLDDHTAIEALTNSLYSVRTVMWDQLVQYPIAFPPYNHDHSYDDATGFAQLILKLEQINATIVTLNNNTSTNVTQQLANHLTNPTAHSKAQVGLGNVSNFGTATLQEAADGARNDLFVTPAGLGQAVAAAGGATGNRTLATTGDVTGTQVLPMSGTWPGLQLTLADAFKGIDTRAYPISTARGPDPDTETAPVFITNHANSPAGAAGVLADNVTRPQFFIINNRLKTGAGDSNLYSRVQLAIEHRVAKTDGAQRVFVRYRELNSPYAWAAWTLISGQDLFTSYGQASTTNADTVRVPVVKLTLANALGGLPAGSYLISTHFETTVGAAIGASTPRFQMARRLTTTNKATVFVRYGATETTWGRWTNATGYATLLSTNNIGSLFEEGEYDQDKVSGGDITALGYPVDVTGRLVVERLGGGDPTVTVANGIKQTYYPFGSLEVHERRYGASAWEAWVKVRMADGSVPAAMLKSVPSAIGGADATTPLGTVRTNLGLGSIAEYNIIISDTEPVSPPAKTLWFSTGA